MKNILCIIQGKIVTPKQKKRDFYLNLLITKNIISFKQHIATYYVLLLLPVYQNQKYFITLDGQRLSTHSNIYIISPNKINFYC